MHIHIHIQEFDAADCEKSIEEDWRRDAKGKDMLSRKAFCDAFFELADTWTSGISGLEYMHTCTCSSTCTCIRTWLTRGPAASRQYMQLCISTKNHMHISTGIYTYTQTHACAH